MPHITFEYTENLLEKNNLTPAMEGISSILVESLPASLASCKSRIILLENYLIGDGDHLNAFIHLGVKIKSGRTDEVKSKTAQKLLDHLVSYFKQSLAEKNLSISVEIAEISDHYVSN